MQQQMLVQMEYGFHTKNSYINIVFNLLNVNR